MLSSLDCNCRAHLTIFPEFSMNATLFNKTLEIFIIYCQAWQLRREE